LKIKVDEKGKVYIELKSEEGKALVQEIESSVGLPKVRSTGNTVQRLAQKLIDKGVDYLEEGQEVWGHVSNQTKVEYNRRRES
jgi:hypothetical protein